MRALAVVWLLLLSAFSQAEAATIVVPGPPKGSLYFYFPRQPTRQYAPTAQTYAQPPVDHIEDFSADITVGADGELTVKETIAVESVGTAFAHGITRDVTTRIRDKDGNFIRTSFDVQSVERDGKPETYWVLGIANGKRISIGTPFVSLNSGRHSFVIVYRSDRRVGFFDRYDQLNWDVTGSWSYPITHAQAVVHLPPGAAFGQFAASTTVPKGHGVSASGERRGTGMRFFTLNPLASQEGLTFSADFSKGAVMPPDQAHQILYLSRDNPVSGAAVWGLVAMCLYYFAAWWRFGRDPKDATVVPVFAPPENLSAASMRFIRRMRYDRKCFAAALTSMAAKGFLNIEGYNTTYVLGRTGKSAQSTGLTPVEAAMARVLFNGTDSIVLGNENYRLVSAAATTLEVSLKHEDEGRYFVTNRLWFYGGVAIFAASAIAAWQYSDTSDMVELLLTLLFWTGALATALHYAGDRWRTLAITIGPRMVAPLALILAVYTTFSTLFREPIYLGPLPIVPILAFTAQGVIAAAFYHLLRRPTSAGDKLRAEIEGFKMYLDAAEKEHLQAPNCPEVTPELFKKFLPYAIALDVETGWSRNFEAQAVAAGRPLDESSYTPDWYLGKRSRLHGDSFGAEFGNSLTDATMIGEGERDTSAADELDDYLSRRHRGGRGR